MPAGSRAREASHRLVAIGDAMIQGFMDGAVFRTDLSWPAIVAFEMGLRPDQFRYPIYEWPHGPGGVPIDLQRLMKAFEQYFGGRSSATLTAMSGPRRVFLSHTSEFDEWRPEVSRSCVDLAKDACSRQGFQFGDMSLWSARPHEPAEECRTRVKACDIYVGIIGSRYGSVVRDEEHHSYTELEYETAKARGIPRLVFLLSDEASMPVRFAKDPEYGARQEAFRAQLGEDGITLARFETRTSSRT